MNRNSVAIRTLRDVDWENWKADDPATLVFVVKDGRILLIRKKRGLGAGKINGPGGRLEPGESPIEGAVREVQEELRITPMRLRFAGVNSFQFVDGYSIYVHIFVASNYEGTPVETDEAAPLWFPLDEIPYDEMWVDDRLWIPHLLNGTGFSGRYIFDGDDMLDYELDVETQ